MGGGGGGAHRSGGARIRFRSPGAGEAADGPLRDRDPGGDHRHRRPAHFPRRALSRVQRDGHRGQDADLDPGAERSHRPAPDRHGRNRPAVLVSRQPIPRLHGRREAEEDRGDRRAGAEDLRRSDGSWSSTGMILYDGTGADPIFKVSAAGGTPAIAAKPEASRKETQVGWPEFLPDGRRFLYMVYGQKPEDSAYRVGSLDSPDSRPVAPAQTLVTYAPPGYLLFVRDRTLVAQPFDAKAVKTRGEPVPLAEHVGTDSVGLATFSVSRDGTLAYRTGDSGARMLWVDRSGKELETIGERGEYSSPRLSRAGDRLAFSLNDPRSGKADIWIRDLTRGVNSRFTFG